MEILYVLDCYLENLFLFCLKSCFTRAMFSPLCRINRRHRMMALMTQICRSSSHLNNLSFCWPPLPGKNPRLLLDKSPRWSRGKLTGKMVVAGGRREVRWGEGSRREKGNRGWRNEQRRSEKLKPQLNTGMQSLLVLVSPIFVVGFDLLVASVAGWLVLWTHVATRLLGYC